MKSFRAIFTFCATIALTVPLAAAQPAQQDGPARPGAMMSGQMPMMGMMSQGGMMQMMGAMMSMMGHCAMMPMMGMGDHIEGRLAFLKTELRITDAQLPQWNAFADALRAHATQMRGMMHQMTSMMPSGASPSLPSSSIRLRNTWPHVLRCCER